MEDVNKSEMSWSWAAHVSTYRFWGLVVYLIAFSVTSIFAGNALVSRMIFVLDASARQSNDIHAVANMSGLFGLVLAWVVVRTKSHHILYLYGLIAISGMALMAFSSTHLVICLGLAVYSAIAAATMLAVPAILAGGRGGAGAFVVVFGIVHVLEIFGRMTLVSTVPLIDYFRDPDMSGAWLFLILIMPTVVAMLFLIPIDSKLFYANPPVIGAALPSVKRKPASVALMCLIVPFYVVYWLYRMHGEARMLGETSTIPSSKAAGWLVALLPFLFPIMMASLNDHINSTIAPTVSKAKRPTWVVVLWSIFFPPVAAALLQSDVNKLGEDSVKGLVSDGTS